MVGGSYLRRRGLAVTAILNMFDDYEFAQQSGLLLAEGVETRFLRDETAATAIEYGLIAAGISLAIIAIVNTLGATLKTKFTAINASLK